MNPNDTEIDYSRLLNRMYELAFSAYKHAEKSRDEYLRDIHDLKILLTRLKTDECESDDDIIPLKIKRKGEVKEEVNKEVNEEVKEVKVQRHVKKVKRKGKNGKKGKLEVDDVEEIEDVEDVKDMEDMGEEEDMGEDREEDSDDEYDLKMLLTPEQRAKLLPKLSPKQSPNTSPYLSPVDYSPSYNPYTSRNTCQTYRTQEEKRYTRMCESFNTQKGCRHGDKCCFAHSIDQYKAIECRHAYDCKKVYTASGRWYNCSSRPCTFLHPNESKQEMLARIGTVEPYFSPFELETNSYAITT